MESASEIAIDGRLYRWVNGTPGTGIAQGVLAAFDPLKALLCVRNTHASRWLYLDSVLLVPTVLPATATRSEMLLALDSITRYSAGGTSLAGVNVNLASAVAASALVHFGAVVTAAESGAIRRILRRQLLETAMTLYKEYSIRFDEDNLGPVVLRPGNSATLHVWHPSNAVTGASFEVTVVTHEEAAPRLPVA